jgi:hypothetical protein
MIANHYKMILHVHIAQLGDELLQSHLNLPIQMDEGDESSRR